MPANSIIAVGDSFRLFGSEVTTHNALPVATFVVQFNEMEGFSLRRTNDLDIGGEKIYGNRYTKVDKIMDSYGEMNRSMGIMLSGDKGQGKSLFLRMLADGAMKEGLPVVRVTQDYPGLADFIDNLGECLVIFDEFEKIFQTGGGEENGRQNQFLSMFDGVSATKRMYCLTVNDIHRVSTYLVNRPGRIHYHMRFSYPTAPEVREYMQDQTLGRVGPELIEGVVAMSSRIQLNYDHLRAIAFELRQFPDQPLDSIIEDLNLKPLSPEEYTVRVYLSNGKDVLQRVRINLFDPRSDDFSFWLEEKGDYVSISFDRDAISNSEDNSTMVIQGEDLKNYRVNGYDPKDTLPEDADDDDREEFENRDKVTVKYVTLSVVGQNNYSYHGAF